MVFVLTTFLIYTVLIDIIAVCTPKTCPIFPASYQILDGCILTSCGYLQNHGFDLALDKSEIILQATSFIVFIIDYDFLGSIAVLPRPF